MPLAMEVTIQGEAGLSFDPLNCCTLQVVTAQMQIHLMHFFSMQLNTCRKPLLQ